MWLFCFACLFWNESTPKWFLFPMFLSLLAFVILYFISSIYSLLPMIIFLIFYIPYVVEGFMNFRYKIITVSLISIFSLAGIFLVKYLDPIAYLLVIAGVFSPLVINNFKDNKGKNF